jgi:hypothetical protein
MAERDDVGAALVRTLRDLRAAPDDDPARTPRLREIAQLSVDLRAHFHTADGEPDWTGRTWSYRDHLRERYREAGYGVEEARALQGAVRWHVSKYVRERLTTDQLESYSLRAASSVDRNRESRAARSALLQAATAAAPDPGEVVPALAAALLTLERLSPDALAGLDDATAVQARGLLHRIAQRATELG